MMKEYGYKRGTVSGRRDRQHRFVAERALGRRLKSCEYVHQINEDGSDNRLRAAATVAIMVVLLLSRGNLAYAAACAESPSGQQGCEVFEARNQNALPTPGPNYIKVLGNNAAVTVPTPASGECIFADTDYGATVYFTASCDGGFTTSGALAVGGGSIVASSVNLAGYTLLGGTASGGNLTLQSTSHATKGAIDIGGNLDLDNTTNANQFGLVTKDGARFIHNFNYGNNGTVTTEGGNTIVGENAGNLTMGGTASQAYHSSHNTFMGTNAGSSNTTGYYDTFMGTNAGYSNTTGVHNTFMGTLAGYSNTTGTPNSFMGTNAGSSNTTGVHNTFMGTLAGYSNTTGTQNTFMGANAGSSNTTGYYNTFMGTNAGSSNTTGYYNTFMGTLAGYSNTTGVYNAFIGTNAGYYLADGSTSNQTSANSVFVGFDTKAAAVGGTNEIVIGYSAIGNGSNSVTLGNTSITKTILRGNVELPIGIATTIGQITKAAASQTADLTQWQNNSGGVLSGATASGMLYSTVQAATCTSTEDGNLGALTIAPTSNVVSITNSDVDGCNITMSETGAVAGATLRLFVISNAGGVVNFADSAGVSELAGTFAADINDSLTLTYANSSWIENARSAN